MNFNLIDIVLVYYRGFLELWPYLETGIVENIQSTTNKGFSILVQRQVFITFYFKVPRVGNSFDLL